MSDTTATPEPPNQLAINTADRYVRSIDAAIDANAPFGYVNTRTEETVSDFDDLAQALDLPPRVLDDMLTIADRIESGDIDPDDAHLIETPPTRADIMGPWEPASASYYLGDALSIRYTSTGRGTEDYLSADIAIAIGGPNVWIDTAAQTLTVYWGGEPVTRNLPHAFCEPLDDAARELWSMGA